MNRNEPQNSPRKASRETRLAINNRHSGFGGEKGVREELTRITLHAAREPVCHPPSRLPRFHNHFPPMISRCPQRRFLTSHPRQPHAARHTHTHIHIYTNTHTHREEPSTLPSPIPAPEDGASLAASILFIIPVSLGI